MIARGARAAAVPRASSRSPWVTPSLLQRGRGSPTAQHVSSTHQKISHSILLPSKSLFPQSSTHINRRQIQMKCFRKAKKECLREASSPPRASGLFAVAQRFFSPPRLLLSLTSHGESSPGKPTTDPLSLKKTFLTSSP